jgi:hypothetical protein
LPKYMGLATTFCPITFHSTHGTSSPAVNMLVLKILINCSFGWWPKNQKWPKAEIKLNVPRKWALVTQDDYTYINLFLVQGGSNSVTTHLLSLFPVRYPIGMMDASPTVIEFHCFTITNNRKKLRIYVVHR